MKIKVAVMGLAFAINGWAGTMGGASDESHPYSVIGSLGYTWYSNLYHGGFTGDNFSVKTAIGDGQTAFGRFAIARDLGTFKTMRFGVEVGVQSGNTARLAISQTALDTIGGLHPQVTIKPMLDLLATASWQPIESIPVLGIIKPGITYRRLQVNDRITFNDRSEVAFELQAGLGIHISERSVLSLNYQGIFNGNTSYCINAVNATGTISNIPMQNGLLLSLSYAV